MISYVKYKKGIENSAVMGFSAVGSSYYHLKKKMTIIGKIKKLLRYNLFCLNV